MTPGKGSRIAVTTRLPILGDDGAPKYLLTVVQDVTEKKHAEARIERLSHYDSMTELPNRAAFNECFASVIERASKADESFALLSVDLDRFKEINDVFGHALGDRLLRAVAERLNAVLEGAFLARLGGDEFAALVTESPAPTQAARLAERFQAAVAEEFEIDGHRLRVGLSIGIAIYPLDGADETALIGNADAALYRAKAEGRGSVRFFEADMDQRLRERRALLQDLRSAVEHRELAVFYQPQARIDGEITGFEALVRWQHPVRGPVSPGEFIPIAEESGLILPLGEWVLREACREAASWPNAAARRGQPVGGAVPARRPRRAGARGAARERAVAGPARARDHRERADRRSAARAVDPAPAQGAGRAHRDGRFRHRLFVAVEPAGVSVRQDQDRPLVHLQPRKQRQSATIVRAVLALGRGLDLPVVAEGVETQAQLAFLSQEACAEVQGYLFGKPRPIADYAALVGRVPAPVEQAANVA